MTAAASPLRVSASPRRQMILALVLLAGMIVVFAAGELRTHGAGYAPLLFGAAASSLPGAGWLRLWRPQVSALSPQGPAIENPG